MSPHRRTARGLRRLLSQWHALVLLTLLWVLLWGDLSWGNVVAGLVIAAAVLLLFPLPAIMSHSTVRPWPFVVLVTRFATDLFVASFQVAWSALRPGDTPHGAIVAVKLRNPDDASLTITSILSSLVPGSLVIEAWRTSGVVFLHVLDIDASGGPDGVRRTIRDLEARVLRAFADDQVLRRTGLLSPENDRAGRSEEVTP